MVRGRALLVAALALAPTRALASQPTPAPAQAQFDYGLAEMEAGRYPNGCPALAESYRLLTRTPASSSTLAECENKWGRTASALTHYEAYLDLFSHMADEEKARQRGREKIAAAQRDRMRRDVPTLVIRLPATGSEGVRVTRDGVAVGVPSLGVALPVDPGEHVVVARTLDGAVHEGRLWSGAHASFTVDLTPAPPVTSGPVPTSVPSPGRPTSGPSTWVWVAGGVGAAGLALGAVAGAVVLGDRSTIDAQCRPNLTCSPSGLGAASQSRTFGVLSDVGFGVAGAGALAAAALLLAAPSHEHQAMQPVVTVAPTAAVVGVRAAW